MNAPPGAARRCSLALLAMGLLATGCGRGGGGDLDHPHTLDAMVREAREAPVTQQGPVVGTAEPTRAAVPAAAASAPG